MIRAVSGGGGKTGASKGLPAGACGACAQPAANSIAAIPIAAQANCAFENLAFICYYCSGSASHFGQREVFKRKGHAMNQPTWHRSCRRKRLSVGVQMFRGSRSPLLSRPWLGALLLLCSSWLAAPAHAGDRSAAAAQQTPAALYHNYCSVCHGDNGDGQSRARGSFNPPPRDFTTPQAMQELTRERMLAAVKGGVPGTAMMAWKTQLNDAQIASVVDYVRDTFMRASVAADAS